MRVAPSPDILPAIDRLLGIIGGLMVVLVAQPLLTPLVARRLPWVLLGRKARHSWCAIDKVCVVRSACGAG